MTTRTNPRCSNRSRTARIRPDAQRPAHAPASAFAAPPDPRALLARLRHRVTVGAVVAFGAFFGLAAGNVVGVTAHGAAAAGESAATAPSAAPTAAPTLAPGDFFGRPGAAVSGAGGAGQAPLPVVIQPPLTVGGGAPMLSTGGS